VGRDLVLNDRYRLVERLATGGMGEVWRAADQALAREVAVKLLRHELMSDASACERFRAEGRFAASLRHGGIAQVYDVGTVRDEEIGAGRAYLVMELVRGEPLAEIVARAGALPAEAVLDVVVQAGRALAAAHAAGIVHRDIKPANLMVTVDGTVKITDFGIARQLSAASQTQTGMVMGTAYYISPEQASGQGVTPSADLYSLGVVAFECLAGRVPFDAATPVEVALQHVRDAPPPLPEEVPARVRELVGELLAKHPAERPADADEVADRALVIRDAAGLPPSGLSRWTRPPASSEPSHNTPLRSEPPRGTPFRSTPPRSGPSRNTPSHNAPSRNTPFRDTSPRGGAPHNTPSLNMPSRGTPLRETPSRGTSARGMSARGSQGSGVSLYSTHAPGPGDPYTPGTSSSHVPRTTALFAAGTALEEPPAPGVPHPAGLPEFDGNHSPDSLGRGQTAARRRTALTYASVAAGTLLLGVIVVGTMWRGFGTAEPQRENQERLPAVQPGEGDPARHLPADPATRLHERRGQETVPSPSRDRRTSTPRYPRASPSQKPTRKPPRATSSAPDPTPRPTDSTTTPSTPSPDPSPTESGELGSEDKV
jgi:serine/threonine-protein kinase